LREVRTPGNPIDPTQFPSMSHQQFVLAYQKGSLGCSVRTLPAVSLFVSGKAKQMMARVAVTRWLLELLGVFAVSVLLYLYAPAVIALVGTLVSLSIFALIVTHQIAELVVRCSLENDDFFQSATGTRVLIVTADEEKNLPVVDNVVPMPPKASKRSANGGG
jgi:hypothetical protein